MPPRAKTKICGRCGAEKTNEAFARIDRSDSETFRLDRLCMSCRVVADAERDAKRRRPNTTVLCQCGCGSLTNLAPITDATRGWVAGKPMRFLLGHNARSSPHPLTYYLVNEETGCWEWQMSLDEDGYGRLTIDGQGHRAHRWFYEQSFGSLPEGMVPDHCCPEGPNRACVNPDHMRPKTVVENSRWKLSTKLDWAAAGEIRSLAGTISQREIACRFGISQAQVSRTINHERWRK